MKLNISNKTKIEAALAAVNGHASRHAYTEQDEILDLIDRANQKLERLQLPKKDWVGAQISATSGSEVSNAYARQGFRRAATHVVIERFPSGWFLTLVEKAEVWQQGGAENLVLTPEQDAIAVYKLRQGYTVQQVQEAVA